MVPIAVVSVYAHAQPRHVHCQFWVWFLLLYGLDYLIVVHRTHILQILMLLQ